MRKCYLKGTIGQTMSIASPIHQLICPFWCDEFYIISLVPCGRVYCSCSFSDWYAVCVCVWMTTKFATVHVAGVTKWKPINNSWSIHPTIFPSFFLHLPPSSHVSVPPPVILLISVWFDPQQPQRKHKMELHHPISSIAIDLIDNKDTVSGGFN